MVKNIYRTTTKNKKPFAFPPEKEMKKAINADPNYNRANIGLMPNASKLDKIENQTVKKLFDLMSSLNK